jgi:hypothetical protein
LGEIPGQTPSWAPQTPQAQSAVPVHNAVEMMQSVESAESADFAGTGGRTPAHGTPAVTEPAPPQPQPQAAMQEPAPVFDAGGMPHEARPLGVHGDAVAPGAAEGQPEPATAGLPVSPALLRQLPQSADTGPIPQDAAPEAWPGGSADAPETAEEVTSAQQPEASAGEPGPESGTPLAAQPPVQVPAVQDSWPGAQSQHQPPAHAQPEQAAAEPLQEPGRPRRRTRRSPGRTGRICRARERGRGPRPRPTGRRVRRRRTRSRTPGYARAP